MVLLRQPSCFSVLNGEGPMHIGFALVKFRTEPFESTFVAFEHGSLLRSNFGVGSKLKYNTGRSAFKWLC